MKQTQIENIGVGVVINYQISKDNDIKKPINFDKLMNILKKNKNTKVDDFKNDVVLEGARTTLKNELKISKKEALNYLMGLPLSFNLKPFVKLFDNNLFNSDSINDEDLEYVFDNLELNFDKKKKLISQNFESKTHIDVKEFKDWVKSRGFIKKKNKPVGMTKKPKVITGLPR